MGFSQRILTLLAKPVLDRNLLLMVQISEMVYFMHNVNKNITLALIFCSPEKCDPYVDHTLSIWLEIQFGQRYGQIKDRMQTKVVNILV